MWIPVHPLTENWFSSSLPFILLFLAGYLGVHYMYWVSQDDDDDGQPKYRELSMIKNALCAIFNAVLSYMMITTMYRLGYSLTCEPITRWDSLADSSSYKIPMYMIFFMLVKIMECSDTLIQIIRNDEPTKWLLFHHASIVTLAWLALRLTPGGTATILASVNCMSHAMVYSYLATTYFMRSPLPMFVHVANLAQFFTILYLCFTSIQRECDFPVVASGLVQLYVGVLILGWYTR